MRHSPSFTDGCALRKHSAFSVEHSLLRCAACCFCPVNQKVEMRCLYRGTPAQYSSKMPRLGFKPAIRHLVRCIAALKGAAFFSFQLFQVKAAFYETTRLPVPIMRANDPENA